MKSFLRESRRKLLVAMAAGAGASALVPDGLGEFVSPGSVFIGVFLLFVARIIWRWNPVVVPRVTSAKEDAKAAERAAREACVAQLRHHKRNPADEAETADTALHTRMGAETIA